MEEPIPLEGVPETKEPVKSEPTASASPGERGGANSPTPECSICLGHLINTSFTDSCLHQFCFTCLLQWSKIKTECPLCKQTFKSIIHNVRSEEDYDQYHVPRELVHPPQVSPLVDINLELINLDYDLLRHVNDPGGRRFAYRTTMTPTRRFRLLPDPPHAQAQSIAEGVPTVSREELRYRRRNPADYRRNVYRHGEWSTPLPGHYAGALERSAEFFRSNPYELNRLIPWINRDLQILLNGNEPHIAYVLRTIMDSLTRHDLRSAELRDVLRPHFGIHTDHFLHELMNYARTGFQMAAYDSFITYPTHGLPSGYLNSVQSPAPSSSSSSSLTDDSDVRVVDHVDIGEVEIPGIGSHPIDMPGPSTVSQALQLRIPTISPTIFIISSNSEESDCEVVGYVKPRHERTPEVIEIPSSDGEIAGPSTSNSLEPTPRSPSLSPTPLDQPSTSQESSRRNPRGARRKASIHLTPLECLFTDSSTENDSPGWGKKNRKAKRTRKSPKTGKKSPRKQCQMKDSQNPKKRNRKTSSSSDDDSHLESKKKKSKRPKKNRPRAASQSSSEDDDEAPQNPKKALIIKIRKDLMSQNQNNRHTEDSSSSSGSSSSTSSSNSSDSDSSSNTSDINLPLKKRKCGRVRRINDNSNDKSRRSKGKIKSTVVKCAPVDSTILRKDAAKKEWYVDKKVSRSRSPSRSSDEEIRDTRLRISIHEYRERKMAELFSSTESPIDEEKRSNSQCSSRSEKMHDNRYKSRHKGKHKEKEREKDLEQPSTSFEKHSIEGKSMKKRRKTHRKHKNSKGKHSKGKNKRDKRHYESSDSSTSSSA